MARDLEPGLSQEDEDFIVEIDSIANMESQTLEEVQIFEDQFDSQLLADLMNIETYMRSIEAIRNTPHFSVILNELERILDTLWAIIGYLKSLSRILEIPAYIDDILSTNIRSYVSRMRARIEASIVENDALDIERTRLYKAKEKELARARARSRNLGRLLIDAIGRSLRDYRNRSALNRVRYIVDLFNRNQAEVRTLQSELDNLSEARGRVAQAKTKLSWAKDRINNRSYNWGNFLKVKKLGETVIVNLERYKRGLAGSNKVVNRLRLGISGADTGSGLVIIELANKADLLKFEALKLKLAKSRQKAVLIERKRLEYFNKWNGYVRKMKSCILDFGHQYRTQSNAFMDDWNRVKKYMKF